MKFNWKVLIALGLALVAAFWMVSSVLTRSYGGTNLNVDIGSGTVTVTNSADAAVPVQLVGTGTRPFTISDTIEGVTGSSKRDGTGSAARQLFEFELPAGTNTFTVIRGSNVKLVSDSRLEGTVEPLSQSDARTTLIVGAIVILGSLYFASSTTEHRWLSSLRRKPAPVVAAPVATLSAEDKSKTSGANRGRDGRAYSDS
jgi:hypothetical protein